MSRMTYPGSGAYLTWDSINWLMNKEWSDQDKPEWAKRSSNTAGELPPILADLMGAIRFQPMAFQATLSAQVAALYPFTNRTQHGAMVFPSSDLPAVIQTKDGKSITYPAGQITKMPQLTFAPDKPLFGEVELTTLLAAGSAAGAGASFDTVAGNAYSEPTMNEADELRDVYALTLGYSGTLTGTTVSTTPTITELSSTIGLLPGQGVSGAGIPSNTTILAIASPTSITLSANATASASGVTLTFAAVPIETDKDGIVATPRYKPSWIKPSTKTTQQARVTEIEIDFEFTPLLMDVDAFYATYAPMQGANIALGKSASASGYALNIAGSGTGKLNLACAKVSLVDPRGPQFDDSKSRIPKVKLKGLYVSGTPLFALTVLA